MDTASMDTDTGWVCPEGSKVVAAEKKRVKNSRTALEGVTANKTVQNKHKTNFFLDLSNLSWAL